MKNTEVRNLLGEQMQVILKRSRQDIPLIALDGLSSQMAKIGKVLLDDDDEFVELIALRGTFGAVKDKVGELIELVEGKTDYADKSWQDVYDRLNKLNALLSYRG